MTVEDSNDKRAYATYRMSEKVEGASWSRGRRSAPKADVKTNAYLQALDYVVGSGDAQTAERVGLAVAKSVLRRPGRMAVLLRAECAPETVDRWNDPTRRVRVFCEWAPAAPM